MNSKDFASHLKSKIRDYENEIVQLTARMDVLLAEIGNSNPCEIQQGFYCRMRQALKVIQKIDRPRCQTGSPSCHSQMRSFRL